MLKQLLPYRRNLRTFTTHEVPDPEPFVPATLPSTTWAKVDHVRPTPVGR